MCSAPLLFYKVKLPLVELYQPYNTVGREQAPALRMPVPLNILIN